MQTLAIAEFVSVVGLLNILKVLVGADGAAEGSLVQGVGLPE